MMERHTCKFCFRRFSNGRALGGHMRSHVTSATNTYTPPPQVKDSSVSPSSSSSSAYQGEPETAEQEVEIADQAGAVLGADEEVVVVRREEAKQLVYYGLRENPKKSYRLVDPVFSSAFAAVDYIAGHGGGAGSSIVLQDRESETESSKPPSLRRRSKRSCRVSSLTPPKNEPSFEPEPVSSVSDTTPEEDVARCLMMLSRDVWTTASKKRKSNSEEAEEEDEEEKQQSEDEEEEDRIGAVRSRRGGRSRYQCGTCQKVFRSYQALGGHRASHKKVRGCITTSTALAPPVVFEEEEEHRHKDRQIQEADSEANADRRIHECPVCFRVFGSGQALGGHKRSHLSYTSTNPSPPLPIATIAAATITTPIASSSPVTAGTTKFGGVSLIDLNLPAPMEDEVEISAVSDADP